LNRILKLASDLGVEHLLEVKSYVPGKPIDEVKRELGLNRVIKMASNENPLGPSPKAVQAIRDSAGEVHLYPDGGAFYLKRALAKKLGVHEHNLILGNGSDEIVSLATRVFLRDGAEAIVGHPSFLMYGIDTRLSRGELISVPLNQLRLDLPAMKRAITPRTRLIFVDNPNNPTGTMVENKEVQSFLSGLPVHLVVVFDEAYHEYVESASFPNLLDDFDSQNIIILRTFSKIWGLAGLRIGYGVASKEIVDILNRCRPPFNVNSLAQVAALASLNDQEQIKKSRELVREGKKFLYLQLRKMNLSFVPTQTNFILVKVGERAQEIESQLLHLEIIVRSMVGYSLPCYLRVTIGTGEQNEAFISRLKRILSSAKKAK